MVVDKASIVENDEVNITAFEKVLPKRLKKMVTEDMLKEINEIGDDYIKRSHFRENILTYTSVLQEGKFRLKDYIKAVTFITNKMLGSTDVDAYAKTFPDRYEYYANKNTPRKEVAAIISTYKNGKLVSEVMKQTLVSSYVKYQDLNAQSIEVQAELMMNANSEMVRHLAAKEIQLITAIPEDMKIQVDVNISEDESVVDSMKRALFEVAKQQEQAIANGLDKSRIINVGVKKNKS